MASSGARAGVAPRRIPAAVAVQEPCSSSARLAGSASVVRNVARVDSSLSRIDAVVEIEGLSEDIQPLLSEVRDTNLLKDVEITAKGLADASDDLRRLKTSMLTVENTDLIKQSVFTLVYTLKIIETSEYKLGCLRVHR